MPNQTNKKDPVARGQIREQALEKAVYTVWQGLVDDYQTLIEITEEENEAGVDNE